MCVCVCLSVLVCGSSFWIKSGIGGRVSHLFVFAWLLVFFRCADGWCMWRPFGYGSGPVNGTGHKLSQAWVNQLPSPHDTDWTGPATISCPGAWAKKKQDTHTIITSKILKRWLKESPTKQSNKLMLRGVRENKTICFLEILTCWNTSGFSCLWVYWQFMQKRDYLL